MQRKNRSRLASWKRSTLKTGWYGRGSPQSAIVPSTAVSDARRIVVSNAGMMKAGRLTSDNPSPARGSRRTALTPDDPEFQPGFEEADTSLQAAAPHYGVYDFTDRSTVNSWGRQRMLERVPVASGKRRHDQPEAARIERRGEGEVWNVAHNTDARGIASFFSCTYSPGAMNSQT